MEHFVTSLINQTKTNPLPKVKNDSILSIVEVSVHEESLFAELLLKLKDEIQQCFDNPLLVDIKIMACNNSCSILVQSSWYEKVGESFLLPLNRSIWDHLTKQNLVTIKLIANNCYFMIE